MINEEYNESAQPIDLTRNQQQVLRYLRRHHPRWVSPTEVGNEVGGVDRRGYLRHSAWGSPICKKLVKMGLVERSDKGHYRALSTERQGS